MKPSLRHFLNFMIVFSCVLPGFRWNPVVAERTAPVVTIYLPLILKLPDKMTIVSAGEFRMGCPKEPCWFGSGYVHNVYLDTFFIDQYEVTNAQYAQCVAAGICTPPAAFSSHSRSSYYDNPIYADYPVFHINWDDAVNYCQWLDKRLPTEAEWEKAAQGGQNPLLYPYPWGDAAPVCNSGALNGAQYDDCSPDDSVQTGSFGPSKYGLYDMAGNVWEWVSDWYNLSYYSNSPYSNPQGPDTGTEKVIRGGSWNYMSTGLMVYDRNFRDPNTDLGNHDVGFRCVFNP